jgi:hypothetical protein
MSEDMARDRVKDEVIKLVQRGRVRQAMQRLSSLGTAEYGEETATKLKSMQFPAAAPDHIYALDAEELDTLRSWRPTTTVLADEDALEAVCRAKNGAAAGPSGWRNEHIRAACEEGVGATAATLILQRIATGEFGGAAALRTNDLPHAHLIDAARLVALNKNAAGTKIRPVAVGETWRRIAGAALVTTRKGAIERRLLRARNFAFSKDGCSFAQKTIGLLLAANPDYIVIETDLKSAFQRANRFEMERQLYADPALRDLIPYFQSLYGDASALFYGEDYMLSSEDGCQQGCSLGSMLYVLANSRIVETVIAEFPAVTVVGFVDDYRFIGPPAEAAAAYTRYDELITESNQALEISKSFMYSPSVASLGHTTRRKARLSCIATVIDTM